MLTDGRGAHAFVVAVTASLTTACGPAIDSTTFVRVRSVREVRVEEPVVYGEGGVRVWTAADGALVVTDAEAKNRVTLVSADGTLRSQQPYWLGWRDLVVEQADRVYVTRPYYSTFRSGRLAELRADVRVSTPKSNVLEVREVRQPRGAGVVFVGFGAIMLATGLGAAYVAAFQPRESTGERVAFGVWSVVGTTVGAAALYEGITRIVIPDREIVRYRADDSGTAAPIAPAPSR